MSISLMKSQVHIFRDADELASKLAGHFVHYIHNLLETKPQVSIVLPGGKTPELFFRRLSSQNSVNSKRINWEFIHFFWSDERCVPSTHPESNYGMAYRALLRVVRIPEKNIHMIRGENDPAEEIKHYSEDIGKNVPWLTGF